MTDSQAAPRPSTSADFDRVPSSFAADSRDLEGGLKLLHADVARTGHRDQFSVERGHGVAIVDLPTKCVSVTLGSLGPGESTRLHRHSYETVLFGLEGAGCSFIGDAVVEWSAGDAVYVPPGAWHRHENRTDGHRTRYLACENAPLLQNLGAAMREEAPI